MYKANSSVFALTLSIYFLTYFFLVCLDSGFPNSTIENVSKRLKSPNLIQLRDHFIYFTVNITYLSCNLTLDRLMLNEYPVLMSSSGSLKSKQAQFTL